MPLTAVIITIVAAGLLLWIVSRFIPMQSQIKSILNGVVAIVPVAGGNQVRATATHASAQHASAARSGGGGGHADRDRH